MMHAPPVPLDLSLSLSISTGVAEDVLDPDVQAGWITHADKVDINCSRSVWSPDTRISPA